MKNGYKEGHEMRLCERHGLMDTRYMVVGGIKVYMKCPECQKEDDERDAKRRSEREFELKCERWAESNIKPKFFGMTFDDYEVGTDSQRKAVFLASKIAEGGKRSLVLCGENGTGKTMLASIAAMARFGAVYKMYEIIVRIKSSYKNNSKKSELDILKTLSNEPLLVIDEVGKQFGSESERNWLSYVIDERYENGLPTILISNLLPKELCTEEQVEEGSYLERYLSRDTLSRLAETADVVWLKGEDYRRKGLDKSETVVL